MIEVVLTACSAAAAQGVMMCSAMQWATGRLFQKITFVSALYLTQHISQETLMSPSPRLQLELGTLQSLALPSQSPSCSQCTTFILEIISGKV